MKVHIVKATARAIILADDCKRQSPRMRELQVIIIES